MKSREFIQDSALDDMVAQVKEPKPIQPKLPYNQSGLGNFIGGQVGKNSPPPTTLGGKLAQGAANAVSPTNIANKATSVVSGLGNALKAGAQSGLGGVSVAYKGPPGQQKQAGAAALGNQPIDYIPGKIDAHVADYLKKAANSQPLKQSTGNTNIDNILKAAGLIKK